MVITHSDNIVLMSLSRQPELQKKRGLCMCGWVGWVVEDSLEVFRHVVGLLAGQQLCVHVCVRGCVCVCVCV